MFNAVSLGAVFNNTAELFPTPLRATAVGVGSSVARIGGILAPQIIYLQVYNKLLPPVIIAIAALFAAYIRLVRPCSRIFHQNSFTIKFLVQHCQKQVNDL